MTNPMITIELAALQRRANVLEASLDAILADYRVAGFPLPFRRGGAGGQRFYHLFAAGSTLALCGGLAAARPTRLMPARLYLVDCLACLDELTRRITP